MTLRISSALAASAGVLAALASTGCECIDCDRAGPTVGYARTAVQDDAGGPVAGASVHLDNRSYVTEPQTTNAAGAAVLLVYMDAGPSDTGTITVFPPAGYEPPLPQAVTIPARDTVSINVTLRRP
jgi:hypothetical protein